MGKTFKSEPKYLAVVGVQNDLTGKRFEAGEYVTEDDFEPEDIQNWVAIGVLVAEYPAAALPKQAEEVKDGGRQDAL